MIRKKQPAPTIASPPAGIEDSKPPKPPEPSTFVGISRVSNGFVAEIYLPTEFSTREREKRVARTPAELGAIVAEWAAPTTPKKR